MAVIDDILKEFQPSSAKTWTELFLKESKQENLQTHKSFMGFEYLPFYTSQKDYKNQTASITGLMAKKGNGWNTINEFPVTDPTEQNKAILASFEKGCSGITLNGHIHDFDHLSTLLKGVLANHIEINFKNNQNPFALAQLYKQWCDQNHQDCNRVFGTIECDPIGNAFTLGKWKMTKEKDLEDFTNTFTYVHANFKQLNCITVDAGIYHYSGANLNQTLTYTILHALEYLNILAAKKINIAESANRITIQWPVGINFFGEIAALRAFHVLWNNLIQHIGKDQKNTFAPTIAAHTSIFYWSGNDKHNNLLRSTTQVMAAAAGGAGSIYVYPYNTLNTTEDNSATRIATNVQLLLREETFMDKVIDPAGGSYFVEDLTEQFYTNALMSIKEIESNGGLIAEFEKGKIQEAVKANAQSLIEAYKTSTIKILGSNLFPNAKESGKLTVKDYFGTKSAGTEFEPLRKFILDAN